jgi:hypothetical protein
MPAAARRILPSDPIITHSRWRAAGLDQAYSPDTRYAASGKSKRSRALVEVSFQASQGLGA